MSSAVKFSDSTCYVCGAPYIVGPGVTPGSTSSVRCPHLDEDWHKEAAADTAKQSRTLHLTAGLRKAAACYRTVKGAGDVAALDTECSRLMTLGWKPQGNMVIAAHFDQRGAFVVEYYQPMVRPPALDLPDVPLPRVIAESSNHHPVGCDCGHCDGKGSAVSVVTLELPKKSSGRV